MSKNKLSENFVNRFMELAGNEVYKDNFLSKSKKQPLKEALYENDVDAAPDSQMVDSPPSNEELGDDFDLSNEEVSDDSVDINVDELESEIQAAVTQAFNDTFGEGSTEPVGDDNLEEPLDFNEPESMAPPSSPNLEAKANIGKLIAESVFESLKKKGFIKKVDSKKK